MGVRFVDSTSVAVQLNRIRKEREPSPNIFGRCAGISLERAWTSPWAMRFVKLSAYNPSESKTSDLRSTSTLMGTISIKTKMTRTLGGVCRATSAKPSYFTNTSPERKDSFDVAHVRVFCLTNCNTCLGTCFPPTERGALISRQKPGWLCYALWNFINFLVHSG